MKQPINHTTTMYINRLKKEQRAFWQSIDTMDINYLRINIRLLRLRTRNEMG